MDAWLTRIKNGQVCNDSDEKLELSCGDDVLYLAEWVHQYCCITTRSFVGQSGQVFADSFKDARNFNVVISYGNCNHDKDADRPGMGPPDDPWGPNGACYHPQELSSNSTE